MAEAKTFGRRVLAATPEEVVRAEQTSSRDERFRRVDELAAALLTASFSGREIVKVEREPVPKTSLVANTVRLAPVVEDQGALLAESFAVKSHQARGAWWLPDDASLKVGLLNLPASFVQGRRFAYGIARDDQVKVALASTPDAVAVWALLQPLFATLLAPIELRSQSAGTLAPEEAKETWAGLEETLADLGLDVADQLAVLRYGSGWSRLKAEEQRRAKVAFVARLAPQVGIEITRRFRAMRVCELVARYYAKATRTAPTQRQVLTRPRGQILAAHFGGDWLAFLDYLEEAPAPGEEIMTALPEARLYATGSERVKEVAAAKGLSPQDVEAMLASFYGEGSLRTPVERRVEVVRRCWAEVDGAHAVQVPGMPALGEPYQRDVQRSMFSGNVLADIDALWDGECLPRWPERIVSSTDPLASMAATFGPALAFWHEIGINAWSLTEGPYTPNSLEGLAGLAAFHRGDLETLVEAGCPVDRVLFDEITAAEAKLGPPTEITNVLSKDEAVPGISLTISETLGTRRNGFEILRDIVTRYRRQWAADHLERYLRWRWESELRQVAWEHSRWLAAKGKAPTLKQFAKIAAPAANHWFGGDIADLFGAFGERPPARAGRVRLMPTNREALVHLVWKGLGGEVLEDEAAWREPERFQRQWTIRRLADEAPRYVQLQEALGATPGPKELFGQRQWPEGVEDLWPRYVTVTEAARTEAAAVPVSAPPPPPPPLTPPPPPGEAVSRPTPPRQSGEPWVGQEPAPGDGALRRGRSLVRRLFKR